MIERKDHTIRWMFLLPLNFDIIFIDIKTIELLIAPSKGHVNIAFQEGKIYRKVSDRLAWKIDALLTMGGGAIF